MYEIITGHILLTVDHYCSVCVFPLQKVLCLKFRNFILRNKALVYYILLLLLLLQLLLLDMTKLEKQMDDDACDFYEVLGFGV